ncbi:unnamed protein product [Clonostachys rhizophaga]|uniref:Uncharacterized protein n=1 Tax=Clonostachys rhizophaga TaxID=160324 RepID=A0A9N9VKX9_9HYPO|nr:unnamed protein product [Clonostachys rhizophaga]
MADELPLIADQSLVHDPPDSSRTGAKLKLLQAAQLSFVQAESPYGKVRDDDDDVSVPLLSMLSSSLTMLLHEECQI